MRTTVTGTRCPPDHSKATHFLWVPLAPGFYSEIVLVITLLLYVVVVGGGGGGGGGGVVVVVVVCVYVCVRA